MKRVIVLCTLVLIFSGCGASGKAGAAAPSPSSTTSALAVLTSPTASSTLTGSTVTFTWSKGVSVTNYKLILGTTGAGSGDLYNSYTTSATSKTVTNLPTNGKTIYATLYSQIGGAWQSTASTYTAATISPAVLTSPTASSTLTGSTVTFTWSKGVSVTNYKLILGTTGAGSSDVYNSYTTSATSKTVTNLPTNGKTIYATLYSQIGGAWQSTASTYTEASPAVLTSPTASSTLTGSTVTFTWSKGASVTNYKLILGTTGAGSSDLYNSYTTSATSKTVTNLPTNGRTIYATLYSQIGGAWQSTASTYTAFSNKVTPTITWATPAAIAVNMALTSTQLDATANVAGTFAYSPALGTKFTSAGTQMLSVIFTPTDTTHYADDEASVELTVDPFGMVAWGDSLTFGHEGYLDTGSYPTELQSLINLPIVNEGVGGQASTQIGVREGSVSTTATVTGGVIPASGGVTVTFPAGYEPVTAGGPSAGVEGTILGVHGNVTLASGTYTFTRTDSGSAVTATGANSFTVDTPYASYLPVFWEGRNNYTAESQVLSDIAAQVATVTSGRNYLVLSVINMNQPYEQKGQTGYNQIAALNSQLSSVYGAHYFDIRTALVNSYDSSLITDVSDYYNDEPPTSLRAVNGVGTLVSAIGPTDTTLTFNLTTGVVLNGNILTIDSGASAENVEVTAISGNTVTVTRNFGGNNTSHSASTAVTVTDAIHLSAKGYQVVANAVATYLSAYAK